MARLKIGAGCIIESEELKKYPFASINKVKDKLAIDADPKAAPTYTNGKYKICFATSQGKEAQVVFSGEFDTIKEAEDFLITVL